MSLLQKVGMYRFEDDRGVLQETWSGQFDIKSSKFVVTPKAATWRGFHYQVRNVQAKLLTCLRGNIIIHAMDVRDTPTYSREEWLRLREGETALAQKGAALGYVTLVDDCIVVYHCDAPYDPEAERTVRRPLLGGLLVSEKDRAAPTLFQAEKIAA